MERTATRRRFLRIAVLGGATGLAGCSGSDGNDGAAAGTDSPGGTPRETPTGTRTGTGTGTETDAEAETGTATTAARPSPESVGLETLLEGLEAPVDVAFAPDTDRRYVVE
jgi:hypothetical protein